jgi:hypothetical protein
VQARSDAGDARLKGEMEAGVATLQQQIETLRASLMVLEEVLENRRVEDRREVLSLTQEVETTMKRLAELRIHLLREERRR